MRTASGALISYLNTNAVLLVAWCYTVTLQSGAVYRWTGADINLSYGGNTFLCAVDNGTSVPGIKRGAIRHARGLEVQTLTMTLITGQTVQMGGVPMPLFAHNGGFDGARVLVEWVPQGPLGWGDTSLGSVVIFEGAVAEIDPETTAIGLSIKSDLEKLTYPMPRVVFQPGCSNAFGDAGCGIILSSLAVSSAVQSAATLTSIPSALAQASGYFAMGTLTMTSGVASGARRTVSAFSGGTLTLSTPLPAIPAIGDTFTVTPGCDRTWNTCNVKWANQLRFRGQPWIPAPEMTI